MNQERHSTFAFSCEKQTEIVIECVCVSVCGNMYATKHIPRLPLINSRSIVVSF